jgi:hypothetical protein
MNFQTPEQVRGNTGSRVAAAYHRAPETSPGRERTTLTRLARAELGESATPYEIDAVVSTACQHLRAMGYAIPPMYSQPDFSC